MKIKKDLVEKIFARGDAQAPLEACGYLVGRALSADRRGGVVEKDFPMRNTDKSAEHFTMDTKEQFDAMRRARDAGLEILAVYHTHPATPARPSEEDIRLAYDPGIVYVIASLAEGVRSIKAFRIVGGKAREERLVIEDEKRV
ncbi:MAG: M67 family metallopeptidase [Endomicrobiia bacterium]|nr:M67 family metallopeptidase [Endomicrobiia bacterium]